MKDFRSVLFGFIFMRSVQILLLLCLPLYVLMFSYAAIMGKSQPYIKSSGWMMLFFAFGFFFFGALRRLLKNIKENALKPEDFRNPYVVNLEIDTSRLMKIKEVFISEYGFKDVSLDGKLLLEKRYWFFLGRVSIKIDRDGNLKQLTIRNRQFFKSYDLDLVNYHIYRQVIELIRGFKSV